MLLIYMYSAKKMQILSTPMKIHSMIHRQMPIVRTLNPIMHRIHCVVITISVISRFLKELYWTKLAYFVLISMAARIMI